MANNLKYTSTFTPRQALEMKCKTARMNLLILLAFTAINVILLIANVNFYLLFSAFIPYFAVTMGMFLCGKFPEVNYTEEELAEMTFLGNGFFAITIVIAVLVLGLYFLAWFMTRRNSTGWFVFTLVIFSIDTLLMIVFGGINIGMLVDIVFHIWVIYYLVVGIKASRKLKYMPLDTELSFESDKTNEE